MTIGDVTVGMSPDRGFLNSQDAEDGRMFRNSQAYCKVCCQIMVDCYPVSCVETGYAGNTTCS